MAQHALFAGVHARAQNLCHNAGLGREHNLHVCHMSGTVQAEGDSNGTVLLEA